MPRLDRLHNWFGLVFAYRLDGRGGAMPVGWRDLESPSQRRGERIWLHLDIKHPNALRWLREQSGLDPRTIDALTTVRAAPHLARRDDALLLVLKGMDYRPGAEVTDMVAARIWTDGRLLISCRRERVRAVADLVQDLEAGIGPADMAELLCELAERMMTHADDVIEELLEDTHRMGHAGSTERTETLVASLARLRRRMIRMRAALVPQRRALARLASSRLTWLDEAERRRLRDVAERCLHAVEWLDAAGEISEITQDEILQRSSETTERRVFSLTVITAIFLPLTFVTGLLGVNLAGIPDASNPMSFLLLCLFLLGIVLVQLWLLRRSGWL